MEFAQQDAQEKRARAATRLQAIQRGHSTRGHLEERVESAWDALDEVASEFSKQGFCRTFGEFNAELLRPFKRMSNDDEPRRGMLPGPVMLMRAACLPVLATLPNPCKPTSPSSRKFAFVLWNVLCFWLGVLDLVIIFLLRSELSSMWAWMIALVDGLLGYLFAYTFYFVFIAYGKRKWMGLGLLLLVSYVFGTGYLTYEGLNGPGDHIEVIEGVVEGLKATANTVVFYHGLQIYCAGRARLKAGTVKVSESRQSRASRASRRSAAEPPAAAPASSLAFAPAPAKMVAAPASMV